MNGLRHYVKHHRHKLLVGWVCVVAGFFALRVFSHDPVQSVTFTCNQRSVKNETSISTFPHTHYLLSNTYGWFDRSHFNTGQPRQVIADVQQAAADGGGTVTIRQGVRNNIAGYTAVYYVSSQLAKADVIPVALGIYLDWSIRFEAWQARPPHGLFGPLTSFAVEDLPSQYLGFVTQAYNIPIEQLFACHLGPVSGLNSGPPGFIRKPKEDRGLPIIHLQNKGFKPLVKIGNRWQSIEWPQPLRIEPIPSQSRSWQFLSEKTWYGKENMSLFLALPSRRSHRNQ